MFAFVAARLHYTVANGSSQRIHFPKGGPYDERLGYSRLPDFMRQLQGAGYQVTAQARASYPFLVLSSLGVSPAYPEKDQAGLEILDRTAAPLYTARHPENIYPEFASIPPVVVNTLLFIENRGMLDPEYPNHNPAIEWGRLANAGLDFTLHKIYPPHPVTGGSTLPTQLQKIRHSPGGRTDSPAEKLRQILSASLSTYRDGSQTTEAQRRVIRDYINSIPLAATSHQGEILGLGDGLTAWYGANFDHVNQLLWTREANLDSTQMRARAQAYRQVLSLLLALKEPSQSLVRNPDMLFTRTNRYLHALAANGLISPRLRDLALAQHTPLAAHLTPAPPPDFVEAKATGRIRARLVSALALKDSYALDRLDLRVSTTLDGAVQGSVTQFLRGLMDSQEAEKAGLIQNRLLATGDPRQVIYSFALYERSGGANLLRVQTDNFNQPLNINEGTKLQLGSTAKLRTLITYLEIIEQLHHSYGGMTPSQLQSVAVLPGDRLTQWAITYLSADTAPSLETMLQAALDRTYSGTPDEAFFTGGGLHYFGNFELSEDLQILTVREGFRQSVNLVFVRLMRDIEAYYRYRVPGASPSVLTDSHHPDRHAYLARFADQEGSVFLSRFYAKYQGQSPDQALETLLKGIPPAPVRLSVIYRSVRPDADLDAFSAFLEAHVPAALKNQDATSLYKKYSAEQFNLADRGYLAHVHPLELWLLRYREQHPQASLQEVLAQSHDARQEVYAWLFHTRYPEAQNKRIRIVFERDAFREIWKGWKRLGYRFDSLVPSYATAIGVSGDTPKALAELAAILINGGVRYPSVTIQELNFGRATPVETVLSRVPVQGERILSPVIAALVRQEMVGVVEHGTGRRALNAFVLPDGNILPVGGKTGTGDNRFKVFAPGGRLTDQRAVNRTAAFVFIIGDRFFGTVTAFVPGKNAAGYEFTSALAVQIFRDLAPRLLPLVAKNQSDASCQVPTAATCQPVANSRTAH